MVKKKLKQMLCGSAIQLLAIYTENMERRDQKTPIFIKVSDVERRKWSTVLVTADIQFFKMSKL